MTSEQAAGMKSIADSKAWHALQSHARSLTTKSLRELFTDEPDRGTKYAASSCGIYFDYSKDHLTETTLSLLFDLARTAKLKLAIDKMFAGHIVNTTENKPALHVALRDGAICGDAIRQEVSGARQKMYRFVESVKQGNTRGWSGELFADIVNLGIGGSDLGARLVVSAFPELHDTGLHVHFVATVDNDALDSVLKNCRPESTLFIIASKSFTTQETLTNANRARQWLLQSGMEPDDLDQHFVATTANSVAACSWGIAQTRIFAMAEWVGGRYSLWSSSGLAVILALGIAPFQQLLDGARAMDEHFREANFDRNLPVIHGLQAIWHTNFRARNNRIILPYAHRLAALPEFIQQLMMESLGKSTTKSGNPVATSTGQVTFGCEGPIGQHSFHQFLLQGATQSSIDFIATRKPHCEVESHRHLVANCLAQSRSLMVGKTPDDAYKELLTAGCGESEANLLAAHKAVPGNRASNTILLDELSTFYLGALLAFYEHSVYVQSVIWDINPFDQWGVELGKIIGDELLTQLGGSATSKHAYEKLDSSTRAMLNHLAISPTD
jgi:glucose-6-phosphate isomerase